MKLFKRKKYLMLCSDCKTGRDSYVIDKNSDSCPYYACYTGTFCAYYEPLEKKKKKIFSLLFKA